MYVNFDEKLFFFIKQKMLLLPNPVWLLFSVNETPESFFLKYFYN